MQQQIAERGRKRLVFYFTATGNSLYVVRRFSDVPISIAQVLKGNELTFEADEIGFVFPDYHAMAPEIVKRFVQRGTFKAPYIFSVITYGKFECNVVDRWIRFAARYNLRFDYIATVLMVDNYLPAFDVEEEKLIDKGTDTRLEQVARDISKHKLYIPFLSDEELEHRQRVLEQFPELFPVRSEDLLVITDRCVSCGLCSQVCPRGNFHLVDSGAQNEGDCEYCLACAHACPQKAIVLKDGEKNREARYRHPAVSIREIIEANKQ